MFVSINRDSASSVRSSSPSGMVAQVQSSSRGHAFLPFPDLQSVRRRLESMDTVGGVGRNATFMHACRQLRRDLLRGELGLAAGLLEAHRESSQCNVAEQNVAAQ